MDFSPIINEVLKTLWWVIPLILLLGYLKSPSFKGFLGEALVKITARLFLPKKIYHPIHNVTLPTLDGTTQIDHIFISCFGIFVVETKNMKGWIFGREHQKQWTQKIFKNSFKFQNPLHQNYKHVKTLESSLGVPSELIHSVIVFTGDSTFKSPMPHNVTHGTDYIKYIKSFRKSVLSEIQTQEIITKIQSERLAPSWETHRKHVQQLKNRSHSNVEKKCSRCGNPMVLRTAQRGSNAGNQFWGCSTYPKCKKIQNIE